MPYNKQPWNQYDKNKTIEDNIQNDAVVTPAKMNHIEDGLITVETEAKELMDALETVVDSNLTATDERIVQAAKDVDKTIQDFKQEVNEDILASNQSLVQLETETDKKFVASDNRITSIEEDVVVEATNQFLNPDFKNGETNWRLAGIAIKNIVDVLEITVLTKNTLGNTFLRQDFIHAMEHKYYLSIEVNPKYSNRFGVYAGESYVIPSTTLPIANKWNKYKVVYKPSKTGELLMITHDLNTNYEIEDKYYIKNILRVDLTKTFGAGNEPTAAQMDRLLEQFPNSWFDGTENIFLARWALNELRRLDDEKANRKQEEWITPTLLNGATGNIQYRKNEFGNIEFKGWIKGTDGASLFQLAFGYRAKDDVFFMGTQKGNGGYKVAQTRSSGSFYLGVPYNTTVEVDFTGVNIPLD